MSTIPRINEFQESLPTSILLSHDQFQGQLINFDNSITSLH